MNTIEITEKALFYMQLRCFAIGSLVTLAFVGLVIFFIWLEKKN